jgi:hypothetical protein
MSIQYISFTQQYMRIPKRENRFVGSVVGMVIWSLGRDGAWGADGSMTRPPRHDDHCYLLVEGAAESMSFDEKSGTTCHD